MFGRGPLPPAANVGYVETARHPEEPKLPAHGVPGEAGAKQDWDTETSKV
jgi:hypothetical protein